MKRVEVNWVAVVGGQRQPEPREPSARRSKTARSSAAIASWVRQRRLRSQPTIWRVQQSITLTR